MHAEHGKVLNPAGRCLEDAGSDGGSRGFEAHAHEDDVAIGQLGCEFERVERGVDNSNVAPGGFLCGERRGAAGHAHHVAEGGYRDSLGAGERDGMVDIAVRGHADGAARARKQPQALGHNRAKSVAPDAHGMRAAYFHEVDAAVAHKPVYAVDEFTCELGIAEG